MVPGIAVRVVNSYPAAKLKVPVSLVKRVPSKQKGEVGVWGEEGGDG